MDIKKIREKVEKKLLPKRWAHTLRVEDMAVKLAEVYGADVEKVRLASLLHDYLKNEDFQILREICKEMDEIRGYESLKEIYHSLAGSEVLTQEFGIEDEDIINAVKYHTVARANMTMIEKIVYIADAIEIERSYPLVKEIRSKAFEDIDEAMIMEIENKLRYLEKIKGLIHPNTIKALKSLKENKKGL